MKGLEKARILTFLKDNFNVDVAKKSKAVDKSLLRLIAPTNPETTDAKVILENDLYRYEPSVFDAIFLLFGFLGFLFFCFSYWFFHRYLRFFHDSSAIKVPEKEIKNIEKRKRQWEQIRKAEARASPKKTTKSAKSSKSTSMMRLPHYFIAFLLLFVVFFYSIVIFHCILIFSEEQRWREKRRQDEQEQRSENARKEAEIQNSEERKKSFEVG
jgi:hypothetical protein